MTKALLPYLLKRLEGHIVNISSMGGFLPVPGQTIYGASKAAMKLLTEGLLAELLDTNVHVSVVFPGAIGTNFSVNSGIDQRAMMKNDAKQRSIKPLDPNDAAAEHWNATDQAQIESILVTLTQTVNDLVAELD